MTSEVTAPEPGETFALLDQVRHNAVRLLSEVGRTPRNLRVKAGDISVEIEWDDVVTGQGVAISVSDNGSAPAKVLEADSAAMYLTAPTVGVFHHAPEPGAEPFVRVGTVVWPGQQVGIIEAMKLMIPVEADRHATVTEVLKPNGEAVEYGEPLLALAPGDG
jgi:acetyl-CoA carboxylase biotin carboxyl carrier protein